MASNSRAPFVESHVPGRLRARHAALRDAAASAALCRKIVAVDGAIAADGNPETGSILVLYDARRLEPDAVEDLVRESLPEPDAPPKRRARSVSPIDRMAGDLNRPAKIGATAALGASVAALAVSRRWHAALGCASLGFLAVHLVHQRRGLFK